MKLFILHDDFLRKGYSGKDFENSFDYRAIFPGTAYRASIHGFMKILLQNSNHPTQRTCVAMCALLTIIPVGLGLRFYPVCSCTKVPGLTHLLALATSIVLPPSGNLKHMF